ncbi:MAG: COP23 domain-containing protein [Geitlerinemataceae cyanobacterium]
MSLQLLKRYGMYWGGFSGCLALAFTLAGGSVQAANLNPSGTLSQLPDVSQETPEPTDSEERFSCQLDDGQYTVMYHPQSQTDRIYPWATPTELGGGWTEERRCNEIARRLEFYRSDGLIELGTSVENGYDVVCVTTQADSRCRIVLTVPPGQDPQQTRDLVFENIVTADSGQSTDAIATLNSNGNEIDRLEDLLGVELPNGTRRSPLSNGINLLPFLDPADGGTGEMLREENSASGNPRLNPENFR